MTIKKPAKKPMSTREKAFWARHKKHKRLTGYEYVGWAHFIPLTPLF